MEGKKKTKHKFYVPCMKVNIETRLDDMLIIMQ